MGLPPAKVSAMANPRSEDEAGLSSQPQAPDIRQEIKRLASDKFPISEHPQIGYLKTKGMKPLGQLRLGYAAVDNRQVWRLVSQRFRQASGDEMANGPPATF
jgi:hypothetical protein